VRIRKGSIRSRVKGFLPIVWTDEALSAHGGLELFSRFLAERGWVAQLRSVFAPRRFETDYGSWRMSLAVIGLLIVGGSGLAHRRQTFANWLVIRCFFASPICRGCRRNGRFLVGWRR
jgi:hypothetical protein